MYGMVADGLELASSDQVDKLQRHVSKNPAHEEPLHTESFSFGIGSLS